MFKAKRDSKERREPRDYTLVWEILLVVTITPALIHGIAALQYIPTA